MHGERRTTENLREMRNSRAEEERITMKTHLQIKWKLSILFEQSLFSNVNEKANIPSYHALNKTTELSQSHKCKEPQLFFPAATPFTCLWNTEMERSAQRSPSEPSQQVPQAPTHVIKHEFPLVFKEIYETNFPLTGLYKTSNSNTNNSQKKNMAHHLFLDIYKKFQNRNSLTLSIDVHVGS